jgi:hypothetical protein
VKRLERMAAEGNLDVQLVLPMAETLGWLRKGVGELGLLPVQVTQRIENNFTSAKPVDALHQRGAQG